MKLSFNRKQILNWILIIAISFLAACVYFAFLFYVHEEGHIFFGSVGNFFTYSQFGEFQYTSFNNIGFLLPGNNSIFFPIPLPTQMAPVSLIPPTIWIAFGGVIAVSCLTLLLSYVLYKFATKIEKLIIIIITIVIIFSQIITNCVCGTDNLTHTAFFTQSVCYLIVNILRWVILLTLLVFFLITVRKLKK